MTALRANRYRRSQVDSRLCYESLKRERAYTVFSPIDGNLRVKTDESIKRYCVDANELTRIARRAVSRQKEARCAATVSCVPCRCETELIAVAVVLSTRTYSN